MPVSKQLARLGPLGLFALFGLSACATWSGYRTPQGTCGASTEAVVTSSPPVSNIAANPPAAAPAPPAETSAGSTLSVPGPVGGVPPAQSGTDSGVTGPAEGSAASGAPPAVPPAPPAAPEAPPRSAESMPAGPATPAAGSNQDELHPQKPLDATASAAGAPVSGQQAATDSAPLQTIPSVASATVQVNAAPPANHPAGALAKLRARFHSLIQPSSKPAPTASKNAKSPGPVVTSHNPPPQVVASVQIPLPMSDQNRVAQEDSRAAQGPSPIAEGRSPVATAGARDSQAGPQSANAADFQTRRIPLDETHEKSASTEQIEQWPFGRQAATGAANVSSSPLTANEFDPIPVDEYKAAVAKANGDGSSLPAFQQPSPTQTDGIHATAPQTVATVPADDELRVVPTADVPVAGNRQVPMTLDAQDRTEPTQTMPTPAQSDSATAPRLTGLVTPAGQVSAAGGTQPATASAPARVVRPPQWIGGRYGQPAWMVPYVAPTGSVSQ